MTKHAIEVREVLNRGTAIGSVLKLSEPLSFWGGFNPKDGRILDQAHPQAGESMTGTILAMPGSRGSAGTPAGIAEALRLGVGPVGFILLKSDVNITTGAQVAARLYDTSVPVLTISRSEFDGLQNGAKLAISDGAITHV